MSANIIRCPLSRVRRLPNALTRGIRIDSRNGLQTEIDRMHAMLGHITDPAAIRGMERMLCKDHFYTIWLRRDCSVPISHIGAWVSMAAQIVAGGYNGV